MGGFLAELKRRHIYRVAAAYAVVAWALLQVFNNLTPLMKLPDWAGTFVLVLLIGGLPLALIFAWVLELKTHDGPARTGASDWALASVAVAMITLALYQQLAATPPVATQGGIETARTAAAAPAGISIAVLPFTNMSGDAAQEFFSDGMTEEITSALAKVPDLRVVARTSAFEFKGKNANIKTMGVELGATHLIEGSVRKAGNRLRITAQLIKAEDGTHVWAQDYDRDLTDVFAIQEDIARAITSSLNMSLGLKPGENLISNRSIDTESYEKYLRAKALIQGRGGVSAVEEIKTFNEVISLLETTLAKNPTYAPAWFLLASAYSTQMNRNAQLGDIAQARAIVSELRAKGEAAFQKAIQLDPDYAGAYSGMAWSVRAQGHALEAEKYREKALAVDRLDSEVLFINGMLTGSAGRLKEALDFGDVGYAVDPFYPNLARQTVLARLLNGQNERAIALAKTMRVADRATYLAVIYASLGRFGEAADALMDVAADNPEFAKTVRLLRLLPAKPAPADLPRLSGGALEMLYLYFGAPERALQTYERLAAVGHVNGSRALVWHPAYAELRKTERFKALMRKVGLVELWRAKGWPDQCHPTTADDFECE